MLFETSALPPSVTFSPIDVTLQAQFFHFRLIPLYGVAHPSFS